MLRAVSGITWLSMESFQQIHMARWIFGGPIPYPYIELPPALPPEHSLCLGQETGSQQWKILRKLQPKQGEDLTYLVCVLHLPLDTWEMPRSQIQC